MKNTFKYSGDIKVIIKNKNKTISTSYYKNSGRWPLFEFFSNCIIQDFKKAQKLCPKYIHLYSIDETKIPNLSENGNELFNYIKNDNRLTLSSFFYNGIPQIKTKKLDENSNKINIGSSNVTLVFNIPFSYIKDLKDKPINLVCLFCDEYLPMRNGNNDPGEPSTFLFVPKNDGSNELGNLLSKEFETNDQDNFVYTLCVEWQLSINN